MIALAIFATLITQSYGGKMTVVEGLSDHACAEAICVAQDGMSCDQRNKMWEAEAARLHQAEERWAKAHSAEVKACEARQAKASINNTSPLVTLICRAPNVSVGVSMGRYISDGDIKTAQCVK